MRKQLKLMQLTTIVLLVALVIVHYAYINKPVLSSLTDLKQSENQLMAVKGKETPIIKTGQKFKFPVNETGFQYQMWLYKTRLCTVEINGTIVPVLVTGFFSKTEKMIVLVRKSNDELKKKLELDKYRQEHSGEILTDYVLVQQRSIIEILLSTIVVLLGLKLIGAGLKRTREMVDA
jgi:hypothetical protein